jgi:predicted Rossmann-fold nucleotide-binding protein
MPIYEQGLAGTGPSKIVRITKTVSQRTDMMFAMADAFIALPGGLDTLVDVLDVISMSHLGLSQKPIALIQTRDEWQPMLDLLERNAQHCLAGPPVGTLLGITSSAAEALEFVERFPAAR